MRQPLLVGRKMGHWVGAETQQQLGGGLLKGGGFWGSCWRSGSAEARADLPTPRQPSGAQRRARPRGETPELGEG